MFLTLFTPDFGRLLGAMAPLSITLTSGLSALLLCSNKASKEAFALGKVSAETMLGNFGDQ